MLFSVTDRGVVAIIIYKKPKVIIFCSESYISKVESIFTVFLALRTRRRGGTFLIQHVLKPMTYIESAIINGSTGGTVLQEGRLPSVVLIIMFFIRLFSSL